MGIRQGDLVTAFLSWLTAQVTYAISKFCRPDIIIVDSDVQIIKSLLKDGDCLVTRLDYELSNVFEGLFTGSFYGHAAIYLNGYIYESVTQGVRKVSVEKFCYTKDGIGLCRLPGADWTPEQVEVMQSFCENQLGDAYDYSLSWGIFKKWYCAKLVYFVWAEADPKDIGAIHVSEILSTEKVTPQDIWDSAVKIKTFGELN